MTFYMHSLYVDARRLMDIGQRLRLPLGEVDAGYLVHSALAKALGDDAPKPFRILHDDGRWLRVLGYCGTDTARVRESAQAFADPEVFAAIDWERHAAKAMPKTLSEGRRYGFEVRLCPVVRSRRGQSGRRGVELDAFLAACNEGEGSSPDRQTVYLDWARRLLERNDAVVVDALELESFQFTKLLRRTKKTENTGRKSNLLQRPDIVIKGSFQVRNEESAMHLIEQGVGRHKAFGFGMMLLKAR